jgi:protein-disulfide isomerase
MWGIMMPNSLPLRVSPAKMIRRLGPVLLLAVIGAGSSAFGTQSATVVPKEVQARIIAQPALPAAGPADANVTIVEFFDYNCPYCKEAAPELTKLLNSDHQVRIIFKEWPIFGDGSTYAARSAIAVNWQGKFLAVHEALISQPDDLDTVPQVDAVLQRAGVDMKRLASDMKQRSAEIDAVLARSVAEAKLLGLRGTPGFLIGRRLESRALTAAQFEERVKSARSRP